MVKIAILGAGAWGTAVATVLADNGHCVNLWCFEEQVAVDITEFRINKLYFSGIELHKNIIATSDMADALDGVDLIIEATPVLYLRDIVQVAKEYVDKSIPWLVLSKGIEDKTLFFPSQIVSDTLGFTPKFAVLNGPNIAREVAEKKYSGSVIASEDKDLAESLRAMFSNKHFKVYLSDDVIGLQVAGALKNVISIFLGMLAGEKYSNNIVSFLVAQGLAEISLVAEHFGGKKDTIYGLPGLGDLLVSSVIGGGRNYKLGKLFGDGLNLEDISESWKMLPEGVNTAKSLWRIIEKEKLDVPLCRGTYEIIFNGRSIRSVVDEFMR